MSPNALLPVWSSRRAHHSNKIEGLLAAVLWKRSDSPSYFCVHESMEIKLRPSAVKGKGKGKEEYLYSAFLHQGTLKALRRGSHSFTCKQHHACLSFVRLHQMSPPQQLRQQTSNCSSLLIYRPRKDERLSCPCSRGSNRISFNVRPLIQHPHCISVVDQDAYGT